MLNSALPAATTASTLHTNANATPTSPTRPSRLRGLSYLRNYTRDALSRSEPAPPTLRRSASSSGVPTGSVSPPPPPQSLLALREERLREAGSTGVEATENGWLPTVQGRSVSRPLRPAPDTVSVEPERNTTTTTTATATTGTVGSMTRSRAATAQPGPTPTTSTSRPRRSSHDEGAESAAATTMTSESNASAAATTTAGGSNSNNNTAPTIRFIPHVETRANRPSLQFSAVSRTLQAPNSIVRVGRYSERETNPASARASPGGTTVLPVGFKSKVVSRRHCEFWCTGTQWYVKDVKSSSGTFLNHVRLSAPGQESRPYPVNDGDVVQLGIDFKGGEEVIFRCVKIRVECNRGWQKSLNSFNTSAHNRLFPTNGKKSGTSTTSASTTTATNSKATNRRDTSNSSSECSICLNPVAPCQALFVAPCSHVWHYKCIRNLLQGPSWPNFLCPNCRFVADLEADVEVPEEIEGSWEEEEVGDGVDDGGEVEDADEDGDGDVGMPDLPQQAGEEGDEPPSSSSEEEESRTTHPNEYFPPPTLPPPPPPTYLDNLDNQQPLNPVSQRGQNTSTDETYHDSEPLPAPVPIHGTGAGGESSATAREEARSATPTSSAPFALAAGVLEMDVDVEHDVRREGAGGGKGNVNEQEGLGREVQSA